MGRGGEPGEGCGRGRGALALDPGGVADHRRRPLWSVAGEPSPAARASWDHVDLRGKTARGAA
eukprot:6209447-Pyramimonas_sp.AAC.1